MPQKKKMIVLGGEGLLGSDFLKKNTLSDWQIICHGRSAGSQAQADLSDREQTCAMLDKIEPDAVLNLVGLTNVDRCELFPNEAYTANVKTVENIVYWVKQADKPVFFVHVSTDQVYDGAGLHKESEVSLKNYYAFSKYAGELVALGANGLVLRTNFFGKSRSTKRSSLTDWLYKSLKDSLRIQVFKDVKFSPLSMTSLSEMISLAVRKEIKGVYNLGARTGMSKADFAYCFAEQLNLDARLMTRISSNDVDFLKTYRPKDMRMDVDKFENAVGVVLPDLVDEIKKASKEYLK